MAYKVVYWDSEARQQRERDATAAEVQEMDARRVEAAKPQVPQAVTMLQARLVLVAQGMLERADELIKGIPGPDGDQARTYWEFATQVLRTDPLVLLLARNLGLSEAQTDQLFVDASRL
jgi:hypothetical protein